MKIEDMQYEINSAINCCNGRIESGANIQDAFQWLNEEVQQIYKGEYIYTEFPTYEEIIAKDHLTIQGEPR
jgi:hypothetical protein